MNLSVTDDTGATTHFSLRYFRMAGHEDTRNPHTGPRRRTGQFAHPDRADRSGARSFTLREPPWN